MNRNVEFKARVRDRAGLEARAARIADRGPETLEQTDTFFRTARGRLKLREFPDAPAELIYYERADAATARESRYWLVAVPDGPALCRLLEAAHGIRMVVRKRRTLYLVGPSRIHLDSVEGLGEFMEVEVVLAADQPLDEGNGVARDLMSSLGVEPSDVCEQAYVDLLEEVGHSGPSNAFQ